MCICINCKHIDVCGAYYFVRQQHNGIVRYKEKELFNPSDTVICININKSKENLLLDWDIQQCTSFTEEPGNWTNKNTKLKEKSFL